MAKDQFPDREDVKQTYQQAKEGFKETFGREEDLSK